MVPVAVLIILFLSKMCISIHINIAQNSWCLNMGKPAVEASLVDSKY